MKFTTLLFFLFLTVQISFAQTWQDTLSAIDKTLSQFQPQNPGLQLSISRNGQLIFSKAWGMADLEHNVPLSTHSILEAGSVSKQFTAAAILLLEQQGKLSLNDNVRKYIPELPDYGTPITLRQLMHHTSGLRDWGDIADLSGWSRGQKFYTDKDVLDIIIRQKHLNFKPGSEFLYCNSNYNLLAFIVQRVSGITLADFTQKYIFEPAGMTNTQWRVDPNRIVPNRAIAYSKSKSDFKTNMPNEYAYGHGGLLTTSIDLLKWTDYYTSGKLGVPSLLIKQLQLEPLNNGEMNTYAAGLFIKKVMGWDNISHDGATASYRTFLETFPELHLSFAIMSNTSQFSIDGIADNIRRIFVINKTAKTARIDAGIQLPETHLNSLAGMYVNERNRSTFQLSAKNDTLVLDNYLPLIAVSENRFESDNFLLQMKGAKGMYIPFSPRDTIAFSKVKPASLSRKDFKSYEGKYFSDEVNSFILVQDDSNQLVIHLNANKAYPLRPTYTDAFVNDELGCDVQFSRNIQNKIFTMKFYFWRYWGVEFKKIKDEH